MWRTRLTLTPGTNGTKRLVERYGDRLVCVRYRYDPQRRRRITTVELVEEEKPWLPRRAVFLVEIRWKDTELRERAKAAGARWNPERKLWVMTAEAVRSLGLESRVRDWQDLE